MEEIQVRECTTIEEFDACINVQREAFGFPDLEISPLRHFIVSRQAGGWTLGAFANGQLIGFVHHLAALRANGEIIGYSHMMAVAADYQNKGVGARLKWAQRERALAEGRSLIRWTWDPMQVRNAHFNLNRLGVTVNSYAVNFYGTDYNTGLGPRSALEGIDSDRLFAGWELRSERVVQLASGRRPGGGAEPVAAIELPRDWSRLLQEDLDAARQEQVRVREEFLHAFANGLVCSEFESDAVGPRYLLYEARGLSDGPIQRPGRRRLLSQ